MDTKICKKCNIEKSVLLFYKQKRNKDGYWNSCIECEKKKYNENSYIVKKRVSEYRKKNKDKIIENKKKYYYANQERLLNEKKIYTKKTRDLRNKKMFEKYHSDILFKLITNLRVRTKLFIKSYGMSKNNRTIEILGANPDIIKNHLESQFKDGMTWDNYGFNGWHIDHIIPLSSAKTEEEVYTLCHYTNLQPLWAKDNFKKGKKILWN